MKYIYLFLFDFVVLFFIFFVFYYLYLRNSKKSYKKTKDNEYVKLLVNRYKLDNKKTDPNTLLNVVSFNMAFSIAFTSALILNIKGYVWKILVSFVVLFSLLFILTEIGGRYLKNKEGKK